MPERMPALHANARTLRAALDVEVNDMPIVPLVFGSPEAALEASARALDEGVFAQAIRPPTVPDGSSRLRLAVMASHTRDELRSAARVLARAALRAGFRPDTGVPVVAAQSGRSGVYDVESPLPRAA